MTDNIIHMDFKPNAPALTEAETADDTLFYEIDTDKPDNDPVFVSVHSEGVELVQRDNEVFITDGQLAGIISLLIKFDEEEENNGE